MVAYICSSPVHIMRTFQLALQRKFDEHSDIYICSSCPNYKEIAQNIRQEKFFNNVYAIDTGQYKRIGLLKLIYGTSDISYVLRKTQYNKVVSYNIDSLLGHALYVRNRKNARFEYHCIEDGPFIYQPYVAKKYARFHPYNIMGWNKPVFHAKAWWLSYPEYIDLPSEYAATTKQLEQINIMDKTYLTMINGAFDYKEQIDLNDADVLIMEESHYTDGLMKDNYDYQIFKMIRDRYPDKKMIMKLHPRTKENRFVQDFTVLEKSTYPWELILLNRLQNAERPLIQISIACGTMMSDKFMFGAEGPKIILAPLFYDKVLPSNGACRVSKKLTAQFEKIRSTYNDPGDFLIAGSMDEVFNKLDQHFA